MKKGLIPGLLLIILGIYILIEQFFHLPDGLGMVFIGAGLMIVRVIRGKGFVYTLAGCLCMALGANTVIESTEFLRYVNAEFLENSTLLFLLAIAFFALHVLEYRSVGNWPIVPGVCLLIVAVVVMLAGNPLLFSRVWQLWPVALICVGAVMLTRMFHRGKWREGDAAPREEYRDGPPDGPQRGPDE